MMTNDKTMIKEMKKPRKIAIVNFLQNFCTAGSKNDEKWKKWKKKKEKNDKKW